MTKQKNITLTFATGGSEAVVQHILQAARHLELIGIQFDKNYDRKQNLYSWTIHPKKDKLRLD